MTINVTTGMTSSQLNHLLKALYEQCQKVGLSGFRLVRLHWRRCTSLLVVHVAKIITYCIIDTGTHHYMYRYSVASTITYYSVYDRMTSVHS